MTRSVVLFWAFVLVLSSVLFTSWAFEEEDQRMVDEFQKFMRRHRKKYRNDSVKRERFQRWRRRKALVDEHNSQATIGESSFLMDDNHFADLSHSEWDSQLLGMSKDAGSQEWENLAEQIVTTTTELSIEKQTTVPSSVDLRRNRCMPPIKTQNPCGGCWAFIAVTAVEYQTCVKTNRTTPLVLRNSEQQLIDCSSSYGTNGCNGGFYTFAWKYTIAVGGLALNSSYPYNATSGKCRFLNGTLAPAGRISSFTPVPKNELAMQAAVLNGPVAVSIVANAKLILYSSGIFDDETCKNGTINHGVSLVGYGAANGTDYWIARNSWGTAWGTAGYILLKRNVNICRITAFPFFAT